MQEIKIRETDIPDDSNCLNCRHHSINPQNGHFCQFWCVCCPVMQCNTITKWNRYCREMSRYLDEDENESPLQCNTNITQIRLSLL